jgi:hypothetical protein
VSDVFYIRKIYNAFALIIKSAVSEFL